jgi:hypothetical protein
MQTGNALIDEANLYHPTTNDDNSIRGGNTQ